MEQELTELHLGLDNMPLLFVNGDAPWFENGWYADGLDAIDDDVWYDEARPESNEAVECLDPDPEPDELPGLSRPGDCVKSMPKTSQSKG